MAKQKPKTDVLMEVRLIASAVNMINRGARVPIITAMLPLAKSRVSQLYLEVTGKPPNTGPLPSDFEWYASTTYPMRIVQSSILANLVRSIRAQNPSSLESEILVTAYDLYIDQCEVMDEAPLLTFVRAWHLMTQIKIKNLIFVPCHQCSGSFINIFGRLYTGYKCPLCKRSKTMLPHRNDPALLRAAA